MEQTPVHRLPIGAYRRIATLFVALTAGVAGVIVLVLFSRATVTVFADSKEISGDALIDVSAHPKAGEVMGAVAEAVDSLSQAFPATSAATVDAPAEGRVRIASKMPRSQTLIATTRLLRADGVLYRIKKTVVVPAAGSVDVDAFADTPGKSGETAEADFTIPGLNPGVRELFSATVASPFVGGTKEARAVTKSDVDGAISVLRDKLVADLARRLTADTDLGQGTLISSDTVRQSTDVAAGTSAEQFTAKVIVHVVAVTYDKAAFGSALNASLSDQAPAGWHVTKAGLPKISVEKADIASGRASLRVSIKASAKLSADNADLQPRKLTGVSPDSARTYLESVDGVRSASVRLKPFWAGRLPTVADHISIEVR